MMYVQCRLKNHDEKTGQTVHEVCWLPQKFAKKNMALLIESRDLKEQYSMVVEEVYANSSVDEKHLFTLENQHKKQRGVSDL